MSTPLPTIKIELHSNPMLLTSIRGLIVGLGERFGFTADETAHIALAVDEALANVIRHGYESRVDGKIWITCTMEEGPPPRLTIEIEDEGNQVDPAMIKGRPLDEIRPGGLGVHIMREVMDRCEFSERAQSGMRLILEKKSSQPDATSANDQELELT